MIDRPRASLTSVAALGIALAVAASGCGRAGRTQTTFHDTHPLPADTQTVAVPEIGTYGGRFVIAQTS